MACSSFHGKIAEIPGISVDNFENPCRVLARAYFLSHCHSDHTQGLYSPALLKVLEKTGACIYMSEETAAVINDEKVDDRLMDYLRPLKRRTTLITLPSVPDRNLKEMFFNVTLVPASHSLGSVMFLFQTKTKTILFTGDFRISSNDISKYCQLHDKEDPVKMDAMYVDTTFIDYRYMNFPKRSTSIEYAIEEIRKWLEKDGRCRVALHTSAKYGYEFVFNAIFKHLGLMVFVNEERWRFYSTIPESATGVTNNEMTSKIHICRNRTEKYDHSKCLTTFSSDHKYLYVHLSAMKWDNYAEDDRTFHRHSDTRLDVCFPTHCSRSELVNFVKHFSPLKVIGFPNDYIEETSPVVHSSFLKERGLATPKKRKIDSDIDQCKGDMKVDREILKEIFEL